MPKSQVILLAITELGGYADFTSTSINTRVFFFSFTR